MAVLYLMGMSTAIIHLAAATIGIDHIKVLGIITNTILGLF